MEIYHRELTVLQYIMIHMVKAKDINLLYAVQEIECKK